MCGLFLVVKEKLTRVFCLKIFENFIKKNKKIAKFVLKKNVIVVYYI